MKKLILFASILSLTIDATPNAFGQTGWVQLTTNGYIQALAANGTNIFAAAQGGVALSTDNGAHWNPVSGLPQDTNGGYNALSVIGPIIAAAGGNGGVLLSTNGGTSWTSAGLTGWQVQAFAALGTNIFAGTQGPSGGKGPPTSLGGVFLWSGNDTNWTAVNSGLIGTTFDGLNTALAIQALAVVGTDLFAGTIGGVFLSTNNGAKWGQANANLPNIIISSDTTPVNGNVNAFAMIGTNLFAGTQGDGVFLSADNGPLNGVNNGLSGNLLVDAFAVSGTIIFAGTGTSNGINGTYRGIFLSTNSGASWTEENTGLTDTNIISLAVNDSFLFAGAANSGVWRCPLSGFVTSAVSPVPSVENSVINYPNPFSQSTTISISPSESGAAIITVVNLLGEEVTKLFDGELTAGEHSFTWDASGVAPGSYWCIARLGDRTERIALSVQR
jgi:hypothetical protein